MAGLRTAFSELSEIVDLCVVCVQDRKRCNIHVPCNENTQGTKYNMQHSETGTGWMHKKRESQIGRERQQGRQRDRETDRQTKCTQNKAKNKQNKHKQRTLC